MSAPAFKYFPGFRTVEHRRGRTWAQEDREHQGEGGSHSHRRGRAGRGGSPSSCRCAIGTALLSWVFLSGYIKKVPAAQCAGQRTRIVKLKQ